MLINEARWFESKLRNLSLPDRALVLNLGSQTEEFVRVKQPWVGSVFLAAFNLQNAQVLNVDLQQAPGVDLVGDLMDPAFHDQLKALRPAVVVVSNVLEHVTNIRQLTSMIVAIGGPGTLLLVSCPRNFPHHPDPIDNGFRPSVAELVALFPGLEVVAAGVVQDQTYLAYLRREPGAWLHKIFRLLLPFVNFPGWMQTIHFLPWWIRKFSATCLILRWPT
jgi:hypothetical protein